MLLCSILIANTGCIGHFALVPDPHLRSFLRDFGLYAFLTGVGVSTGHFLSWQTICQGIPILVGSVLTVFFPMVLCWFLCRRCFHMEFLPMLGAVAGSMTSTPGLAAATSVSLHRSVVQSYATVYPIALVSMIVLVKILYIAVGPMLF